MYGLGFGGLENLVLNGGYSGSIRGQLRRCSCVAGFGGFGLRGSEFRI